MRTFGTLSLSGDAWVVDAEPQVILRLKRIFKKAASIRAGALRLTDTEENARELEWILQRYPLVVEQPERLAERANAHRSRMDHIDALLAGTAAPREFDLALPAREYQRVAADLALRSGGLLVADDVGLGKTVTAIAMLRDPSTRPALIVTLAHLPRQWERELAKFSPDLRTHVLKKGTPYDLTAGRRTKMAEPGQPMMFEASNVGALPDVIICNYHKLAGWDEVLAKLVRSVVFDECQELRHGDTNRYKAARLIAEECRYRMGLSATPVYNYGGEIFSVLGCIRPGALGERGEFVAEWCDRSIGDKPVVKDPRALGGYLREAGLMLRRTRKDVGRELPAMQRLTIDAESDDAALDKIEGDVAALAKVLLAPGRGIDKMKAGGELDWRLRQATGIGKVPFIIKFVRMLADSEQKIVVYAWHREVHGLVQNGLADLSPVLFTGSESPAQKDEARRRFVEGDSRVLIMSLRAGAGLDGLQKVSRTVVFAELDWSPGCHEQCEGRVFRDGQPDPVVAYYLVSDSGSDPVIADVLGLKEQQSIGIRDPQADRVAELQIDPNHVKRLAEEFLRKRGLEVPTPTEEAA